MTWDPRDPRIQRPLTAGPGRGVAFRVGGDSRTNWRSSGCSRATTPRPAPAHLEGEAGAGRDGWRERRSAAPAEAVRRSDVTYTATPRGGAVFAAGSMCRYPTLAAGGYDNDVARITHNVLTRFLGRPRTARRLSDLRGLSVSVVMH